jgi:hypothetical protein
VGAPFNHSGYKWNMFVPKGFGVGSYHPKLCDEKQRWFCSQHAGIGLQVAGDDEALSVTYDPPRAQHRWRLLSVVFSVSIAALGAALVGLSLDNFTSMPTYGVVLIAIASALVLLVVANRVDEAFEARAFCIWDREEKCGYVLLCV